MTKATSSKTQTLSGTYRVPGDKSISHRALMLASIAKGSTSIYGLLEGDDVLATAKALQSMGVTIEKDSHTHWRVNGVGLKGLKEPAQKLDMGNSGTAARLMMGLVAGAPFPITFTGDESLRKRPMKRVIEPLSQMGIEFISDSQRLPITLRHYGSLKPLHYTLPVASAQVKSAILLAGLWCHGTTTVDEPIPCRDHTERMLQNMGADLNVTALSHGGNRIIINGGDSLEPCDIDVPSDPSSAAFLIVAALITPMSDMTLTHVGMNPQRIGLFKVLESMGGDITYFNEHDVAGEPVADIRVRSSTLQATNVAAEIAPSMIDEYPILAVAASYAKGTTTMHGLAELKVKESNRLQAIADGLSACGVECSTENDALIVQGQDNTVRGGGSVATHMDHRIAMAFLIMGLASKEPVTIDDTDMIHTSFPDFIPLMTQLGAAIDVE